MARVERLRELLSGPPDPERIKQRTAAGWQLVALEWERRITGEGPEPETMEDVPLGCAWPLTAGSSRRSRWKNRPWC